MIVVVGSWWVGYSSISMVGEEGFEKVLFFGMLLL